MSNATKWKTAPISPTCERIMDFHDNRECGCPTSYAYPAMNTGWMALCFRHAQKHLPHVTPIEELINSGEKLA